MAAGLLLATSAPRAELTGRLFFTPQERAMLDGQRHKNISPGTSGNPITVSGLVTSSRGKSTVWINQVPQRENENPQGITVLKSTARSTVVPLQLPSGKQVRLKPGQTFDTAKDRIREGYQESEGRNQGTENR